MGSGSPFFFVACHLRRFAHGFAMSYNVEIMPYRAEPCPSIPYRIIPCYVYHVMSFYHAIAIPVSYHIMSSHTMLRVGHPCDKRIGNPPFRLILYQVCGTFLSIPSHPKPYHAHTTLHHTPGHPYDTSGPCILVVRAERANHFFFFPRLVLSQRRKQTSLVDWSRGGTLTTSTSRGPGWSWMPRSLA